MDTKLLVLFGLLVASSATGCNGNSGATPPSYCNQGNTHSCKGATGCIAVQKCLSNGTWSACICGSSADGGTAGPLLLGGACSDDSSCPTGATCLLPTGTAWLGGGPPAGFCVADCSSDVALCNAFGNAICVSAVRPGSSQAKHSLCMPTCDLTVGTSEALACSVVPSSGCDQLDTKTEGFCRPFCIFDSECPSGHCDRQVGVCVAEAPALQPLGFGETCDPTAPSCDGVCLKLAGDSTICSNRCIFVTNTGRECATEGASPISSICAYATTKATPGNVGYCTPLCDCNDDCAASGFVCRAFSTDADAGTQSTLKHVGMCVPATVVDATGTPTTQAGVACGG